MTKKNRTAMFEIDSNKAMSVKTLIVKTPSFSLHQGNGMHLSLAKRGTWKFPNNDALSMCFLLTCIFQLSFCNILLRLIGESRNWLARTRIRRTAAIGLCA
jgi:hypothetical protein